MRGFPALFIILNFASIPFTILGISFINMSLQEIPYDLIQTNERSIFFEYNNLTTIPAHAFSSFSRLERLKLNYCNVSSIFDTALSKTVLKYIEVFGNNIISLSFLKPSQDTLVVLKAAENRYLRSLESIDLSKFGRLRYLDFSHTLISKVPDLGLLVPTLHILKLAGLDLQCDCKLAWMKASHGIPKLSISKYTCNNHTCHLGDKEWRHVEPVQLFCPGGVSSGQTLESLNILQDCRPDTCISLQNFTNSLHLNFILGDTTKKVTVQILFNTSDDYKCDEHEGLMVYMENEEPTKTCHDRSICMMANRDTHNPNGTTACSFLCTCRSGQCSVVHAVIPVINNTYVCDVALDWI